MVYAMVCLPIWQLLRIWYLKRYDLKWALPVAIHVLHRYRALSQFVHQKDAEEARRRMHMCPSNSDIDPKQHKRQLPVVTPRGPCLLSALPHVHLNTTHAGKQVMKGCRCCFPGGGKAQYMHVQGGIPSLLFYFFGRLPLQVSILITITSDANRTSMA
jgi:hypothetical protein